MQKISISSILRLSLPLILANSIAPILGLINTIIVGHLSNAYTLGAIALGASIFDFLFNICNFLRMSTTGLVAQAIDAPHKIRIIITRALLLAVLIGIVLIVLQVPIGLLLIHLIKTTPNVAEQTYAYFRINIWSAPAELTTFVITGWLVALKRTRQAFYLVILLVAIAAPLGWLLVDVVKLHAAGIGYANVVATLFVMLLGLYWLQKEYHFFQREISWRSILNWSEIKPILALNANVFLRTLALMLVYSSFTIKATQYGSIVLAANALLINMLMFSFYGLDGVANITESFVGSVISQHSNLKNILHKTLLSAVIVALVFSCLYALVGNDIIAALTNIASVKAEAARYLHWTILFPLFSVAAFWLDGIFVGALKGKAMRNAMVFAMVGYFAILYLTLELKNNGLWLSMLSFMVLRALIQTTYMKRKDFFKA